MKIIFCILRRVSLSRKACWLHIAPSFRTELLVKSCRGRCMCGTSPRCLKYTLGVTDRLYRVKDVQLHWIVSKLEGKTLLPDLPCPSLDWFHPRALLWSRRCWRMCYRLMLALVASVHQIRRRACTWTRYPSHY